MGSGRGKLGAGMGFIVIATMPACALIDAMGGSEEGARDAIVSIDAWRGDGGATDAPSSDATLPTCLAPGTCFGEAFTISTSPIASVHTVIVDHFDSGPNLDVALAGASGAMIFWGNDNGTLGDSKTVLIEGVAVQAMAAGDFTGSNVYDLAIYAASGLQVYPATGDQSFATPIDIGGVGAPLSIAAVDFQETLGLHDLLVAINGGGILPITCEGAGEFTLETLLPIGGGAAYDLVGADFTEGSHGDFAYSNVNTLYFYEGNGDGAFGDSPWGSFEESNLYRMTRFRKWSEDNDWIVMTYRCDPCDNSQVVKIRLATTEGPQMGSYSLTFTTADSFTPSAVATGSFINEAETQGLVVANGDRSGFEDLLLVDAWSSASFGQAALLSSGLSSQPAAVATGDLNGDGIDDIVVSAVGSDEYAVILSRSEDI